MIERGAGEPPHAVAAGEDSGAGLLPSEAFQEAYGEPLTRALDLRTWHPGEDLGRLYLDIEAQVQEALRRESALQSTIRDRVFPRIWQHHGAPAAAGVYQATAADIARVHRALLFNGGVEAADSAVASHETLAAAVTQIGVCLVNYQGDRGSWAHRLFRRDLRVANADPVREAIALIERRQRLGREGEQRERLTELGRRGVAAYAERAVLLDAATAPWRLGDGNPVPYELLTGSGSLELLEAALALLARLIGEHRRFVFVPRPLDERGLLTIGHALRPLEYAVLDDTTGRMRDIVEGGHATGRERQLKRGFVAEYGPQVLIGIYRAAADCPPRLFYAHADHVHEAALIALADSALQEHRGYPTLLDLADAVCRTTFGAGEFAESVRLAYAQAGEPYRWG